eukprot:759886-Hanusia_phi.AAC.2
MKKRRREEKRRDEMRRGKENGMEYNKIEEKWRRKGRRAKEGETSRAEEEGRKVVVLKRRAHRLKMLSTRRPILALLAVLSASLLVVALVAVHQSMVALEDTTRWEKGQGSLIPDTCQQQQVCRAGEGVC